MTGTGPSDGMLRMLVAVAALVVVTAGLSVASTLLVPLVLAGFVALVSYPMVSWLERHRLPKWAAVSVTLAALGTILIGPGLVVYGAATQFAAAVPRYRARLGAMTIGWFEWLEAQGVDTSQIAEILNWAAVLDFAGGLFTSVAFLLSNALLVLFIVAFVLMEAAGLPDHLCDAFQIDHAALDRFRRVTGEVQGYLRIKTAVSLVTGLLVGLWAAFLDIDFAVLWGLLAFLLNYIPNFGSIMAAVPPVLLALVQAGAGHAAGLAAGLMTINLVFGYVVEPSLTGRQLQISPLVVVLSLSFWGWMWGPVGMVLAVPITMVIRILAEHSPELRWVAVLLEGRTKVGGGDAPA
ncbi:MAG: AI-2E family transporter [Vicinamibacterales bacterium]|nr:AI-2E family transporter [Vicinamibacterales bacterium]